MVDNKEVGLVRLDVQDGKAEIPYQISKDYRGMGYGKQILKFLECYVKENNIASILLGEVKFSNISSQRIFEGLNYKKITKNNKLVYIKEL
jgi:predicted acetyltransferase